MKQFFEFYPIRLVSLLFGLCLLITPPILHANVTVYIVAPDDTPWRIADEQLKSGNDWQRLLEFNKVLGNTPLKVGQALRIPVEWMKDFSQPDIPLPKPATLPSRATIKAVDPLSTQTSGPKYAAKALNEAHSSAPGVPTIAGTYGNVVQFNNAISGKLSVGDTLSEGAKIQTSSASSANIVMPDGSMIVLLENTEFVFGHPSQLLRGEVEYTVTTSTEKTLMVTHAGSISAKTSRFRATALDDGSRMQVEVQRGKINITSDNSNRSVTTGMTLSVKANNALPVARHGLMRPDTNNLAKRGVNGEIKLAWNKIKGASGYRAQLVYAADTYLILLDERLEAPSVNWHNISPGRYNIRLRSLDASGIGGLNAELSFIVQGTLKPPNYNAPEDGIILQTNKPWISWSRVSEANSYVLQVSRHPNFSKDTQEFSYLVNNYYKFQEALAPGKYYWRLKSVAPKKVTSLFGPVRTFIIKP